LKLIRRPNVFSRKPQICEQLRIMDGKEMFDGFQFKHNFILDHYVHLVPTPEEQPLIRYREVHLPLKNEPPQLQFVTEALFVS
jgi:hypothetical protein